MSNERCDRTNPRLKTSDAYLDGVVATDVKFDAPVLGDAASVAGFQARVVAGPRSRVVRAHWPGPFALWKAMLPAVNPATARMAA